MDITNPDIWTYLLAAVAVGAGLGLLLRGVMATRQTETVSDEWQNKVDDLSRQRDRMTVEIGKLRTNVEAQQGVVNRHEMAANKARTDLESAHEKAKLYSKDLFNLRAERENTKTHLSSIPALNTNLVNVRPLMTLSVRSSIDYHDYPYFLN